MQQYTENTGNLIEYFLNLFQLKTCDLYARDTTNSIANKLAEHPEKIYMFYGEIIINAVNFSRNALETEAGNLFKLFNCVLTYDRTIMGKQLSLCYEMRRRLELLYCAVILFNNEKEYANKCGMFKNEVMNKKRIEIYKIFKACESYYYTFFKPSFHLLS